MMSDWRVTMERRKKIVGSIFVYRFQHDLVMSRVSDRLTGTVRISLRGRLIGPPRDRCSDSPTAVSHHSPTALGTLRTPSRPAERSRTGLERPRDPSIPFERHRSPSNPLERSPSTSNVLGRRYQGLGHSDHTPTSHSKTYHTHRPLTEHARDDVGRNEAHSRRLGVLR